MKTKVIWGYTAVFSPVCFLLGCFIILNGCKNDTGTGYIKAFAVSDKIKKAPCEVPDTVIAQIEVVNNFSDDSCFFSLAEDREIRVITHGEGADYTINPALIESYDNDGVEVYFDMNNEKHPYFNVNGDDRQYRILWKLLSIDGQNINAKGVEVGESDPSPGSYIMEIKFPWSSLGYIMPAEGRKIGFDVGVLDNDGQTREALYAWYSNNADSWTNTSFFGTLVLAGSGYDQTVSNDAVAVRTGKPPVIDRNVDPLWTGLKAYEFRNVITGKLDNKDDLYGYFKTCWDEENLYLLVCVKDDVKSYASVLFDYGWIEDTTGNVIWKMDMSRTKHAGGGLKNRYIDTVINIKAGQYYLRYQTDESNSPSNWDVEPPISDFYGIKLIRK